MIRYVEVEYMIHTAHSLKEKRAVLNRVLQRVRNKFNVSIAEFSHQDVWQRTGIALVAVSSDAIVLEKEMERCLELMDSFPEWERLTTTKEWL